MDVTYKLGDTVRIDHKTSCIRIVGVLEYEDDEAFILREFDGEVRALKRQYFFVKEVARCSSKRNTI